MLKNQENHLLNGWFCVKQPDPLQLEAGISWEDAKSSEKEFFDTVSPWKALDARHRSRLGSEGLAERLAANLSELASREYVNICCFYTELWKLTRAIQAASHSGEGRTIHARGGR